MKKTSNLILAFVLGIIVVLTIAAVRAPIYSEVPTLIQRGRGKTATDGTVTNSFTSNFGAIPNVVVTQEGAVTTVTNIVNSVTVSNFVLNCGGPNVTNSWIAVGPK